MTAHSFPESSRSPTDARLDAAADDRGLDGPADELAPFRDESFPPPSSLAGRLRAVAGDRASSAARVVLETAAILREWIAERPDDARDGAQLEAGLAAWAEAQGWRGPCALWLDSLRRAFHRRPGSVGESLSGEMACWLAEDEGEIRGDLAGRARDRAVASSGAPPWNGEPLAPGRRLPRRQELARHAARTLDPGECVLVTAWSETAAVSLEAAWREGRGPEVFVGEGSPHLDGRRMARRLAHAGLQVTMAYDGSILGLIPRVDRVWLATEAIGAGAFLARAGTRSLLEECARRDVPVQALATSDKLVPGGGLRLPAWCEQEPWLLWEDAPEGVRLESQMYESVPIELLELVGGFLTEAGLETAASLHLRSLRVEAAPPCDSISTRARANTF